MILPSTVVTPDWTAFTPEAIQALQIIIPTDENSLSHEYVEIPKYIQWWGVVVANLRANMEAAKNSLDVILARAYLTVKMDLLAKGDKATEKTVDSFIEGRDDVVAAKTQVFKARKLYDEAQAHLEALKAKKEMVIALGFQKRFEMDMELREREFTRPR